MLEKIVIDTKDIILRCNTLNIIYALKNISNDKIITKINAKLNYEDLPVSTLYNLYACAKNQKVRHKAEEAIKYLSAYNTKEV